jgi:tetratricopeptide (TPR) repeat protein
MSTDSRLDSWKKIAMYLERDERTVQRWHTNSGLPVHHVPGPKHSSVFAYRAEVDRWLNSGLGMDVTGLSNRIIHGSASEAMELWECRSEKNMPRIIELSKKAILENPRDPDAYGILASAYTWAAYIDLVPASYAFLRAERAIRKALSSNPRQVFALCAQAWLIMCGGRNQQLAEERFRECIAQSSHPSSALIGLATICVMRREFDDAKDLAMRAWKAEPLSASVSYAVIRLHYCMGEYDSAILEAQRAISAGENSSGLRGIAGLAYAALDRGAEAVSELQNAANSYPTNVFIKGALGYAYAVSGQTGEAKAILAQLVAEQPHMKASSAYVTALICAGLNDSEQTLCWLERGEEDFSIWSLTMEMDGAFEHLRNDDRFLAIADRRHAMWMSSEAVG